MTTQRVTKRKVHSLVDHSTERLPCVGNVPIEEASFRKMLVFFSRHHLLSRLRNASPPPLPFQRWLKHTARQRASLLCCPYILTELKQVFCLLMQEVRPQKLPALCLLCGTGGGAGLAPAWSESSETCGEAANPLLTQSLSKTCFDSGQLRFRAAVVVLGPCPVNGPCGKARNLVSFSKATTSIFSGIAGYSCPLDI